VDGGASLVQVQDWMGHADIKTTMHYLHSKSRAADAALLRQAFTVDAVEQMERAPATSQSARRVPKLRPLGCEAQHAIPDQSNSSSVLRAGKHAALIRAWPRGRMRG